MNKIAVALDVEHDNNRLIEIGCTTIDLAAAKVLNSYSIPFAVDFDISRKISNLTGWANAKLRKQGLSREEAIRRVTKYCCSNRLLITDMDDEIPFIEDQLGIRLSLSRINISTLFKIMNKSLKDDKSLLSMLLSLGLEPKGVFHSGKDDSLNIARIFLRLTGELNED